MNQNASKIIMGSDHAAYSLKETLKRYLAERKMAVEDVGTHGTASVNYVDYAAKVARAVSEGRSKCGHSAYGTGLGMSIVANRFPGIRAALCNDLFNAMMGRRHNNANILVMGGRVVGEALALEIVKVRLETSLKGAPSGANRRPGSSGDFRTGMITWFCRPIFVKIE